MVTLQASRNRISGVQLHPCQSVCLNVLSLMMFFFCSELECFRASIPPPADIGDRDTFLRRSLQPMAIDLSGLHALSEKPMFLAFDHLALKCRLCFRLKRLLAWRHRILQQLMFLRG